LEITGRSVGRDVRWSNPVISADKMGEQGLPTTGIPYFIFSGKMVEGFQVPEGLGRTADPFPGGRKGRIRPRQRRGVGR